MQDTSQLDLDSTCMLVSWTGVRIGGCTVSYMVPTNKWNHHITQFAMVSLLPLLRLHEMAYSGEGTVTLD